MPQRKQLINRYNFKRGLITEASLLEFPVDASVDEENFILKRNGERHRRKGIDYEASHVKQPITSGTTGPDEVLRDGVVNNFLWTAVGGNVNLTFLVMQWGNFIKFHDITDGDVAVSSSLKGFQIDLHDHQASLKLDQKGANCTFARGRGNLYITSSEIRPLIVKYDVDTDTITTTENEVTIRDFGEATLNADGSVDIDERPASLSGEHQYNLENRGWPKITKSLVEEGGTSDPVNQSSIIYTFLKLGFYPALSDVFIRARAKEVGTPSALGAFSPWNIEKFSDDFANNSAPKGNRKHSALNRTRLLGAIDPATGRGGPAVGIGAVQPHPGAVAFFSGRLWYGGENVLFFSQLGQGDNQLTKFYQEASPTDEFDNVVVETDGGEQPIPEIGIINALVPAGKNLFAFSNQGIWVISGVNSAFSATSISINQLSDLPVRSHRSVVFAERHMYLVSDAGIYRFNTTTVTQGQIPEIQNITEDTIQTKFLQIGSSSTDNMVGVYNQPERQIQWLYQEAGTNVNRSRSDKILHFDIALSAFTFTDIKATTDQPASGVSFDAPDVYGAFQLPGLRDQVTTHDVVDNSGVLYNDAAANQVTAAIPKARSSVTRIMYIFGIRENNTKPGETKYTFGEFTDTSFLDWDTHNQEPGTPLTDVDAAAFLVADFFLQENPHNESEVGYLRTFMNRTETVYKTNGFPTTYDFPSGLKVTEFFDWSTPTPDGGATGQQFYNLLPAEPPETPVVDNPFDNGRPVTQGHGKINGRGRSVSFLFQSEAAKDCQILGWSFEVETNTNT